MALYIGTNYHPHDWTEKRWKEDICLMKEAGFNTVRLGHLCWDSYEPEEGVYTFEWFDEVMDLFSKAGIKVVLDVLCIQHRDGYISFVRVAEFIIKAE